MCLLTFFPPGQMPDADALRTGAHFNADGHGFAIVTANREIIVRKSMNAEELIEQFMALRTEHCTGPALFHSRYATHGTIDVGNCHPFAVAGDGKTVFAHNGIMPANVQPLKGDRRSDTRITAENFIPEQFGNLGSKKRRKLFEEWMTNSNKAVILSVDGAQYPEKYFILNESQGIWDDGIWYSNSGYCRVKPKHRVYNSQGWQQDGDWVLKDGVWNHAPRVKQWWDDEVCSWCGYTARWCSCIGGVRPAVKPSYRYDHCWSCGNEAGSDDNECLSCGFCFDCMSSAEECECYTPTESQRADFAADIETASRFSDAELRAGEFIEVQDADDEKESIEATIDRLMKEADDRWAIRQAEQAERVRVRAESGKAGLIAHLRNRRAEREAKASDAEHAQFIASIRESISASEGAMGALLATLASQESQRALSDRPAAPLEDQYVSSSPVS